MRSKEESEKSWDDVEEDRINGKAKLEKEVLDTNYWLKGSEEVDFTKMRPTALKFNSFELEAVRVAKELGNKLHQVYGKKTFLNIEEPTERGLKNLMKRTKKEGVLVVETDKSLAKVDVG